MTELQISLIVIGAVIIIGVIAYNKWQEYCAHRKVERAFADAPDDVLMQSAMEDDSDLRREPVFFENTVAGVRLEDPAMHADISITGLSPDYATTAEEAGYAEPLPAESVPAEPMPAEQVSADAIREPYIDLEEEVPVTVAAIAENTDAEALVAPVPVQDLPEAPVAAPPVLRHLPVDDLIDYPVFLTLEEPLRAEKLLPFIQSLRYTGNKPVHFIGLAKDEATGESLWQPVVHGGLYHQLKAGVQLANRAGALNEIEYSELITRLRQMADNIQAEPEVPDMTDVLKEARSLYQFVVQHDARLGINIRSNGAPWSIKTLMALLERQKWHLRPDGFFVMHDVDGSILFSLAINETSTAEVASRLTLLLDVPCVSQEKDAFGVMIQCAKDLCQRLNGILVDDADKMLSDPMLKDIAGQVNVFYEEMKAVSIPAGSVRAMRLFH